MKLVTAAFCCLIFLGCASHNQEIFKDLRLSDYENIKWADITVLNAKDIIGIPDVTEDFGKTKNETVWIYTGGKPPSSRLTLLFNKIGGRLLTATWFFRSYDKHSDLKFISDKYQFDLHKPRSSSDFFSIKKNYYTSSSKNMELTVDLKHNSVESMSWIVKCLNLHAQA